MSVVCPLPGKKIISSLSHLSQERFPTLLSTPTPCPPLHPVHPYTLSTPTPLSTPTLSCPVTVTSLFPVTVTFPYPVPVTFPCPVTVTFPFMWSGTLLLVRTTTLPCTSSGDKKTLALRVPSAHQSCDVPSRSAHQKYDLPSLSAHQRCDLLSRSAHQRCDLPSLSAHQMSDLSILFAHQRCASPSLFAHQAPLGLPKPLGFHKCPLRVSLFCSPSRGHARVLSLR